MYKRFFSIVLLTVTLIGWTTGGRVAASTSTDTASSLQLINVNYDELEEIIRSYRGKKAVLLNIWATWCGPCVEELPYLVKLQKRYSDQLKVILVSADLKSDRSRVIPMLEKKGVTWKTYYKVGDNQRFLNQLSDQWTGALPFTKIIDKKGKVVAQWQGSADFRKFKNHIQKAIED